jgi:pyruvate/2-oxoglutarate dehydrogenase complex dihydrolipoamide dehydrogenase (E3) component
MSEQPLVEPQDEHNAELVANVHPPGWRNPDPAGRYNLVVIGAGTAGLVTAAGAAGLGAKVALVEKHLFGGDCLNVGCVPSKCMIRSSRALADVRDAGRFGIRVPDGARADFPAVMERMRRIRSHISHHDAAARFRELGVDIFLGEGRFAGPDTVEVDGQTLRFRKAVIATGARAVRPDYPGLEEAGFLTNETVFSLTELPARLVVFGAGPLGCELAQTFARLGSRVTIIEKTDHLLPREDADAARIMQDSFERDGISILTGMAAARVQKLPDAKRVFIEGDGGERHVDADAILVGAGRAPNVQGLNLEAVGVEYDERRGVLVDDHLRTTNRRIFAAGDICLRHKFTHTADASARIVIQNALFWGRAKVSALTIPWCTYTDPEIAHVGLYESGAEERGIPVDTFVEPFAELDRALADGEEEGFVKVHVRRGTDRIVGATIVARHAGEMISELTLAIATGVGLKRISGVIHPYPTQAEAIRRVSDAYNRTRLTPFFRRLTTKLMAWRR